MTIPLRHFLVGLGFLLAGGLVGLGSSAGVLDGLADLAHVHLFLAGWVCVTIMGAMTQFVPVWSGVSLHSRRLSSIQLWLVVVGLVGFSVGLLTARLSLLAPFGGLMATGFWVFVYNLGRTLWSLDEYDVTERHFALALGFFLLLTVLGFLLALDFGYPLLGSVPVSRSGVVGAHATLAVFGAVLTTVFGALYQLSTMFTQTDRHGIDVPIRQFEEIGYPVGVLALAAGRLFDVHLLGVVGGVLVVGSVAGYSVLIARRLYETQVDWTPMLSRYAVLAPAMAAWALLTAPAWLRDPLATGTRFGAPGTAHLLAIGVVGFVVLGTLYHVVPFIIWVHRYSDLLGYEPVPMIDDLYSDRLAKLDFVAFLTGGALITLSDLASVPDLVVAIGGGLLVVGSILFLGNMVGVIREHSPHTLPGLLGVPVAGEATTDDPSDEAGQR